MLPKVTKLKQNDNVLNSNLMNRMSSHIEDWDKDKVTGLNRKTCGADTRAAGATTVDNHCSWNNGTYWYSRPELCQSKVTNRYEYSCKSSLICHRLPRAPPLRKSSCSCAKAWYNALLPGLTTLLDIMSSLPCGVAEALQCIELSVQAHWQALPIKMRKCGQDFQLQQLTAVQDVITQYICRVCNRGWTGRA